MTKERTKRKRIFYVPGMISLVLIPLFCFYHFYKEEVFKVYSCIDVSFPDENSIKKNELEKLRKYKVFYFNNEKSKELYQLKELRFFVRGLIKNYDTINGARIHFGSKMDYGTYVDVLNMTAEEKVENIIQYDNNMYVLGHAKPKGTGIVNAALYACVYWDTNKEFIWAQERKAQLERNIALFKKNWILFLGYIGLAILNVVALVKFNKKENYNQKDYI